MSLILVAEDNPASRELMMEILESEGFRVLEACDGEQAIAQLRFRPKLALVDIRMPKRNGFEVLRAIRSEPQLAETQVFAVTAFAMEGDREHALAAGFDGYISKPISGADLIAKVKAVIDG
jgi:CheY-like chemotaxis protein